jgi:DNA-binding CsgD family transcriptional regulator
MPEQLSHRDILRLRKAMAQVRSDSFLRCLKNLLIAKLPIDTLLILQFETHGVPRLHNGWLRRSALLDEAMAQYLAGAYRLDPFYQFQDLPADGGLYRLSEIAPDRFFISEYYLNYYGATRLCDEVGLLCPLPDGSRAHLSLSRRAKTGPYKRKELNCLRHYAPLLLELLRAHCLSLARSQTDGARLPEAAARSLASILQTEATGILGVTLTRREAQIAELVLQGHSNASAALKLGIAYETAKVHRRNIYRKLSLSSQGELFALFKHVI